MKFFYAFLLFAYVYFIFIPESANGYTQNFTSSRKSSEVEPKKSSDKTTSSSSRKIRKGDSVNREYLDFFEKIYKTMAENYYRPIFPEMYARFLVQFENKIYPQLKETNKSIDFIRWRSAALLVEKLRSPDDIFSALYPPEPAKEYETTALGVKQDLGLEGKTTEKGFVLSQVEPRSDAYTQGLRINDIVLSLNKKDVKSLSEGDVQGLLNPLINTKVPIRFFVVKENAEKEIEVTSKEYFKQTVFMTPVKVHGIFCLEIKRFNRMTSEDLYRYIKLFKKEGQMRGLILDLRNNPGGPPLAAREISSFFLKGGDEFAYFLKRGQDKALLDVPDLPEEYHYEGPLVILINKGSGSASELFAGILQRKNRAVLMGTNSAGQVFLKSMFHFDDGSMVLLVTGRGFHPDGAVFSFGGLVPDRFYKAEEKEDIISYAAKYLVYVNLKESGAM